MIQVIQMQNYKVMMQLYLMNFNYLVNMVLIFYLQQQVLNLDHHHHVEQKMFYVNLNDIHQHLNNQVMYNQLMHSYLHHPYILNHHYHVLFILFLLFNLHIHHMLMDMLSLYMLNFIYIIQLFILNLLYLHNHL